MPEKIKLAYTCRHTRAPQLLSQGVPPAKGAEQLGNSVQVFLNTYAEWIDDYSETDVSVWSLRTPKSLAPIRHELGTKSINSSTGLVFSGGGGEIRTLGGHLLRLHECE